MEADKIIYYAIIIILLINYFIEQFLSSLNLKNWKKELPKEFESYYDKKKYEKARKYLLEKEKLSFWENTFNLLLILIALNLNFFYYLDNFVKKLTDNPILISIIFFAVLGLIFMLINLPFSYYNIFVIESKYGFNKMTIKTFISDFFKSLLLGGIIGTIILSCVQFVYIKTGSDFWWIASIIVSTFMIFMVMFYTTIILPIFNKLTPLEKGELREKIEGYCKKVGFKLKNIYVMDGSKRSSKSNAFFSGLGPKKTIVLFDTLIEKHSTNELVAILAHEVGHYKKKHILISTITGILQITIMIYLFSLFANSDIFAKALHIKQASFHIGLLVFSFLYSPINMITEILMNILSRKNEYEADKFAAETFNAQNLITSLLKLSVDNLTNPYPHPAYVFVYYSHPPVLKRIEMLKKY